MSNCCNNISAKGCGVFTPIPKQKIIQIENDDSIVVSETEDGVNINLESGNGPGVDLSGSNIDLSLENNKIIFESKVFHDDILVGSGTQEDPLSVNLDSDKVVINVTQKVEWEEF